MNTYSSTVDTVARLNHVATSSEAQLYLHKMSPLKISVSPTVNHQLFVAWMDILTKRQTDQRPVFVRYETSTNQVFEVISPIVRKVDHIGTTTNDGNLKIGFLMAPSMYFIKTSTHNYNAMHQILNDAFHSKKDVLITSDPETLELLDVRLP